MFAIRPTQGFYDPWTREYMHMPEDLAPYGAYAAPYTQSIYDDFNWAELVAYPTSRLADSFYSYNRPCQHDCVHPSPTAHAHHQQHFLHHPQAEQLLHRAHPAVRAYTSAKVPAACKHHDCEDPPELSRCKDAAEPGVPDRAYPAYRSRQPSAHHTSGCSSRVHPFSQILEPMHRPAHAGQPSPFSTVQVIGQQPPSTAASAASSKGRHCIPVHAAHSPMYSPAQRGAVHQAQAASASVQQQQQLHQKQAQQRRNDSCTERKLSRSEAATKIQSWWRMRRLARQRSALKALAVAAAQLRSTGSLFLRYKEESSTPTFGRQNSQQRQAVYPGLSHKQYLELNELAMRVLLQLDATCCGVHELRAVRKRLTAAAIKLLDEIQASYSAAVNASMELPEEVVRAAVSSTPTAAPGPSTAAAVAGPPTAEAICKQEEQQQQETEAILVDAAQKQQQHHDDSETQQEPAMLQCAELQQQQQQQQESLLLESGQPDPHDATSVTDVTSPGDAISPIKQPGDHHFDLASVVGCAHQQQQEHDGPSCVHVVFVYPGSRADAATQTGL